MSDRLIRRAVIADGVRGIRTGEEPVIARDRDPPGRVVVVDPMSTRLPRASPLRRRSMDATLTMQAPPKAATPSGDSQGKEAPLSADELRKMDAYWRASNYLSVGQIYLLDNPLLKEPLKREHIKPRLLGHWGTSPGLNMLCVHLNRVIKRDDLNMIYIIGPGHGGPSLVAHAYLEGTYSEVYPEHQPGRGGDEEAVQAVQLPGRHPQPRRPGDAGQHPRGRRARLRPEPRLRGRVRQPRPDRRLRRRRRRGGDRRRSPPAGTATSSSTRPATAACCRSST